MRIRKLLFVCSLAVALCFIACNVQDSVENDNEAVLSGEEGTKVQDVIEYTRNLLDVDFEMEILEADMEIKTSENGDESSMIRIVFDKTEVDGLEKNLQSQIEKGEVISSTQIPRFQDHEYAVELKTKELKRHFNYFKSGQATKTRDINIYLAEDGERGYLYIFG